ncbi:serine:threonine protein kinase haspin-like [Tropilaelaps mercedesae]|uniref:Serine:threonine protein kinase haspin-like n=1 Tax=Tropilaelaps mercedesae TaxID=418985 RepID=A0A1V9XNY6_9ACAR|nr:serine:threonine protein kinase haspin-like [Tropilaelaps mercedesae]
MLVVSVVVWSFTLAIATATSAGGLEKAAGVSDNGVSGKIASILAPSELKTKIGLKIDQLIAKLQENPRTAKFLDFLYENKSAVYFSTTCFIVGTSLLIILLIFYNPVFPFLTSGRKQTRRFRLADQDEEPELESLIVKKNYVRDHPFKVGGAGDMISVLDMHISPLEPPLKIDGPAISWPSTLTDAVISQPRRVADPYAGIIELCKQKMPARFADILELKNPEDVYTFIGRTASGAVYRFSADAVSFVLKIFPVLSETAVQREILLRSLLYLNRLHMSPLKFLCRNFVEIQGTAFVQDDYPACLMNLSSSSGDNSREQTTTAEDSLFDCGNYIVISMEIAGTPLSRCLIKNAAQAKSIVQQLCFTLATGEQFAGYSIDETDVDKVYLKSSDKCKIDFRVNGISVAVKLVDGVIAKLSGTSFSLGTVSYNENQLIEAAERHVPARAFDRNIEFLSRVVRLLLERIPRDVDPQNIRSEQKIVFDLKDIESHLRNFDCVYRFTMFKFIQPRKTAMTAAAAEAELTNVDL